MKFLRGILTVVVVAAEGYRKVSSLKRRKGNCG